MAEKASKVPKFLIGPQAKRELRRELRRATDPAETIQKFQQTHSLHTMFAKSFGTRPHYENEGGDEDEEVKTESLDTDSVLSFLTQLGVGQHEVHKRVSDALQKDLEAEIRKVNSKEALLNLLKNSWGYATSIPELRPILWAVLKQLGDKTPHEVLIALAERDDEDPKKLKHDEIFRPLPGLLKKLIWEADWDERIPQSASRNEETPKQRMDAIQTTLLGNTFLPLIKQYCSNPALLDMVAQPFVSSARERRVLTTQRRALTSLAASSAKMSVNALTNKAGGSSSKDTPSQQLNTGRVVAQLRHYLNDINAGSAPYRPKLLHAALCMLMVKHGSTDSNLTGSHLHCTLVADMLLSSGGPLPKAFADVHSLARVLDDAVKDGVIADKVLIEIQAILKRIFKPDQDDAGAAVAATGGDDNDGGDDTEAGDKETKAKNNSKGGKSGKDSKGASKAEQQPTTFLKRQLNMILTASLTAMKEADPQSLFLNPVTDEIAPGYSKIIKKPMCITTMEEKIERGEYNSLSEFEANVRLMFKNCVDYNRGPAGQWFRGEANRQHKVFKDEILAEAKRLYSAEVAKRNPDVELPVKRKREEETVVKPSVVPLPASNKKRKKDIQEYTPSMPALASMLLADPFVVRLLLDRVLRSLRVDVLKGSAVPAAHMVIPSVVQLLHFALFSTHICAANGNKYIIPDAGLTLPSIQNVEAVVPYNSLRKYFPVIIHLLLETELDRRLVVGGTLHDVAEILAESRQSPPTISTDKDQVATPPQLLQVPVAVLEGAFCFACLPGNSQDSSLAVSFIKFSSALRGLMPDIREERAFFLCLLRAILRHKTRLHRNTRDAIIDTWMAWLSFPPSSKKKRKPGSMTCAAHEFLIRIITEWAALGNLIMPRDLLLKITTDLVEAVDKTESNPDRRFCTMWAADEKDGDSKNASGFGVIKKEYERMLGMLPSEHADEWRVKVGLESAADVDNEEADVDMEPGDPMEEG